MRLALFLGLLAAISLACGGGDGPPAEPSPTATPESRLSGPAEQALAAYVETTLGRPFKEDCGSAQAAIDAGKVCSIFRGERGNERAYILGLTFSEPTQWAILRQQGGQWAVVHTPAITPDNAGVPGVPWPLRVGAEVVVIGAEPCVNVRTEPRIDPNNAVDCIRDGSRIRLAAGPARSDNFEFWQIEGRSGWVVSDYLRYPDAVQ